VKGWQRRRHDERVESYQKRGERTEDEGPALRGPSVVSYQQLPNVVVSQGNGFRTATIVLLIIAATVGVGMVVLLVTFSLAFT
jgi:hypothetical protein